MNKLKDKNLTDNLLKQEEVAEMLGIWPETVSRWTKQGLLPCVRVGRGFLRYERPVIFALLASRRDGKREAK